MNFTNKKQKKVFRKEVTTLKKYSFLLLLLVFLLSACSENTKVSNNQDVDEKSDVKRSSNDASIIGVWKSTIKSCNEEAEVTFNKEGKVHWIDESGTIAGEYEKNTDNIYTFNLNNSAFTATINGENNQYTLEIGGSGIESCTLKKQND
ncbi:hypothetical protein ABEY69_23720 [Priestia filamentosa]|uniref:hypothetical protein n=1 Tax=Priestia filamentosa TaxID=1402861 RepID=UPI003D2C3C70